MAFDIWKKELELPLGRIEDSVSTGIKIPLLEGNELVVKYSIETTASSLVVSFGAGFCNADNMDDCSIYYYILKDALFPYDQIIDGNVYQLVIANVKDAGESQLNEALDDVINAFFAHLGLPEDLLDDSKQCPVAKNLEMSDLIEYLESAQLPTDGTRAELERRYTKSQLSCSVLGQSFKLNDLNSTIFSYSITNDCMRIDACAQLTLPNPYDKDAPFQRSFNAFVELDPCNFVIHAGFEKLNKTLILFEYDWGKLETVKLASSVYLTFSIGRNLDDKVFEIDMGIRCGDYENNKIVNALRIPIPLCNTDFVLQGNLRQLANSLGGQLNHEVFNLLIRQLSIETVLSLDMCTLPATPSGCPAVMNVTKLIPTSLRNVMKCVLADNCFGVVCCLTITFKIPLTSITTIVTAPFSLKLDPCAPRLDASIGAFTYSDQLLDYDWGKEGSVSFGSGDPAPVTLRYILDKYETGFTVDLKLDICVPIDDERFCFPEDGLHLLDQEQVPLCNITSLLNVADFSLNEWIAEKGGDVKKQLSEASREALFKLLGIDVYMLDTRCDQTRKPYSPSANGWNNQCPLSFVRLMETLPKMLICHIPDYCTGLKCCLDIERLGVSFYFFLDIDLCNYVISGGIEKQTFTNTLFSYEWGKNETIVIVDVFRLTYSIRKSDEEKMFIINLRMDVCLEKDGACLFGLDIMDGTKVPQPGCNLDFSFTNFSMGTWLQNNGLANLVPTDLLWDEAIKFILEISGLGDYLLEEPCTVTDTAYHNLIQNWNNQCPVQNVSLPVLPANVVCNLADSCTAVQCCAYLEYLRTSIEFAFNIDFCDFKISGHLETFNYEKFILNYNWGQELEENILGVMKLKYSIDKTAKNFVLDISVSVCMDAESDCQLEVVIFKDTMFPIPICNLDMGFINKDFSLTTWLADIGQDVKNALPAAVINTLLETLGVKRYMLET